MNYNESIEYIHSTPKFSRVLGNDVLRKLLEQLGSPQKSLPVIHIGGTNGKGSVCAMISSVLAEAGYKTGMFTSPYIERFNERIQINGEQIADDDLAEIVTQIRETMENSGHFVSEFALGAAAAFVYFKRMECDFAVIEVGMGGRLDATNVIDESLVTVITSVSLDHTEYLGNTIGEIAAEKCGIIKQGGSVVTYPTQDLSAMGVIKSFCAEKNAHLHIPDIPEKIHDGFIYKGKKFELPLKAVYQPYNAVMALEAVKILRSKGISISDNAVYEGIKNVRWIARFEKVMDSPAVYIDGAHNFDAVKGLCETLNSMNGKIFIIAAMMKDKDVKNSIQYLSGFADRFYAADFDYPRCADREYLAGCSQCPDTFVCESPENALKKALHDADDDTIICVCGSLYFAGIMRGIIKETLTNRD